MLKADLHIHTNDDPKDYFIKYSWKDLIDHAARLNYDVISITCHDALVYSRKISDYAKKKAVLLVPGCERTIEGRHVLLYNFSWKELLSIKTFEDLRKIKKSRHLVIAAHPFYPHPVALRKKLACNIDLFDSIEYSQFYTKCINFNKKALKFAKKTGLPLVANSDAHSLAQISGTHYSFINSNKNLSSVIKAIKKGLVEYRTHPLNSLKFLRELVFFLSPKNVKFAAESLLKK